MKLGNKRRRLGMWLLFIAIVLGLIISAWALITRPVLSNIESVNLPPIDPARLETHVRMLSETFFPRNETHPENLDRAAAYIRQEFKQAQARVSEQTYEARGKTYRNVMAMFGPETKERIVIGAHYDAAGEMPGADDNASGVAGLIELARLFGQRPPQMLTELVAFTLEEPPQFHTAKMGSAIHAASLKQQGVSVRAMIALEMIGCFNDAAGSQGFPNPVLKLLYPSTGNFIAVVSKLDQGSLVRRVKRAMRGATPLPVYSINAPRFVPGIDFSDHLNYWEAGYDAVMITDTAFYRNPRYHTPQDTPQTLDYQRMAMVVQGVYAVALALR
jgi:Zn-dependent M28 family amino/carboxypeptidase